MRSIIDFEISRQGTRDFKRPVLMTHARFQHLWLRAAGRRMSADRAEQKSVGTRQRANRRATSAPISHAEISSGELSAARTQADRCFEAMQSLYSRNDRHYHTGAHIEHCLEMFDMSAHLMADPEAVELTLWFHDAIYEPGACDNEAQSAKYFAEVAREFLPPLLVARIVSLIMLTEHKVAPNTRDEQLTVDIDLSSFGLPWAEFLADSLAVREELCTVPDEQFFPAQRAFLEGLLARENLFYSDFFRGRLEEQARDNISSYLNRFLHLDA